MRDTSAIIIGGGVIGACCAYYLQKSGWNVTIIDRGEFGSACSHGNCGLISPSHALPLAMPGAIAKTLPTMLKPDAPFRIAPRFDPDLWKWLFKFAMQCKESPMLKSAVGRHALLTSSVTAYRDMLGTEGIDCEWEERGMYMVYQTEAGMNSYAKSNKWLKQFGLGAERIGPEELEAREPALRKKSQAGAWFYKVDSHMRPDKLMAGLKSILCQRGVKIIENTSLIGFKSGDGSASAIETTRGDMQADRYVVATGSWTPKLNRWLGTRIPIQPGKGYSITYPRPSVCPSAPLAFMEQKVVATPFASGYRLGSTMEFAGYDSSISDKRLNALKRGASIYLREPYCEPELERWFGWRPMTYDGKPIIDQCPSMSNVYLAAGHNMLGLSMGPATGMLIDELLSGKPTHIDPAHFSVRRF